MQCPTLYKSAWNQSLHSPLRLDGVPAGVRLTTRQPRPSRSADSISHASAERVGNRCWACCCPLRFPCSRGCLFEHINRAARLRTPLLKPLFACVLCASSAEVHRDNSLRPVLWRHRQRMFKTILRTARPTAPDTAVSSSQSSADDLTIVDWVSWKRIGRATMLPIESTSRLTRKSVAYSVLS